MTIVQHAIEYAEVGIRVFPVHATEKRPLIPRKDAEYWQSLGPLASWQRSGFSGHHCAHTDPAALVTMWVHHRGARIGAALNPGTVVIDLDSDALATQRPELHGLLESADTYVVGTRRGHHYYFSLPVGLDVKQGSWPLWDTRVGGLGWTVLPPSEPYRHVRGQIDQLAELYPRWTTALVEAGEVGTTEEGPRRGVPLAPSTFTSGEEVNQRARNTSLMSLLGRRRRRFDADEYEDFRMLAHALNRSRFDSPMDDAEVDAVAASSWSYRETDPAPAAAPPAPPPAPEAATEEPCSALRERYRNRPAHVELGPDSLAIVAARGFCRGRYNRMQRGDAAIEISIDGDDFRAYSDELHAAQFWGRCEEVATHNGRPWREPGQKRRREMLLRWVGQHAYDGPGTDIVQDVLTALEDLPDGIEFVSRDDALDWASARRSTEKDARNVAGNEVWADIRKAFAVHSARPGNDPWREHRATVLGKRLRGWARRDGDVRLLAGLARLASVCRPADPSLLPRPAPCIIDPRPAA